MIPKYVPVLSLAAALLLLCACSGMPVPASPGAGESPRGIVLVVGDGMGAAHFTFARMLRGSDYEIGELPTVGLVATHAADRAVTDSAAAATAYATGVKTNHHYVGVDPSGAAHPTVLEVAERRGLATGLVSTAILGDATPAAFAAHAESRSDLGRIIGQMLASGAEILASTGLERFGTGGAPALAQVAAGSGYEVVRSGAGVRNAGAGPVLAVLPSAALDGESPGMPLHELALWALERLSKDPDGFFLLVEHEGTDTASHRHDTPALERSLVALDKTVGVVREFARRRGDILVIVVGDHETGGLQVAGAPDAPEAIWRDGYHSGEAVPIFSEGPGAQAFTGFLDNTEVGRALLALVGGSGA